MLKLGSTVLNNFAGAGNAALTNVEQLGASANWQTLGMLIVAALECRQLRSNHCPLAFTQMPASQVEANDIGNRVIATIWQERGLDSGPDAGPVAIAAIEDLILVNHYRLAQAVCADVLGQRLKVFALDEGEDLSERVEFERRLIRVGNFSISRGLVPDFHLPRRRQTGGVSFSGHNSCRHAATTHIRFAHPA